jgi:hypothetical protein
MFLEKWYQVACIRPTDIYEHIPTLRKYGSECTHITEAGVSKVVSSFAFATALLGKPNAKFVQIDPVNHPNIVAFGQMCKAEGLNTVFYQQSDLECPLEQTELFFIDTWHVYGHMKRELDRWNSYVTKYIIMHDTTLDEWNGETIRCRLNAAKQSIEHNMPLSEINRGIWPAIHEFLHAHPEWKIRERFTNNNGLTVLERV